ncbi:hypothetical protein [Nonomuraea sp. NPDC048826]|uniref:hypothetical protein n=1 Tax=Nonomuraea sp. NPDC048826 TaxID=3364347 RepID=UPI00370F8268
MFSALLDRLWGPKATHRVIEDGPCFGWVHLPHGIAQVQLALYQVTTARPRGGRKTVTWEVEWATDLDNPQWAPIKGDPVPVPKDAVENAAWDVLACVLIRDHGWGTRPRERCRITGARRPRRRPAGG